MNKTENAIKWILLANIALFALDYYLLTTGIRLSEKLALYYPKNENFGIWQFVTSMFMHGGWVHILFNMYALWAFGSPLAMMWGSNRFYLFYFISGIGAGLIYTGVDMIQFHGYYQQLIEGGVTDSQILNFLNSGDWDINMAAVLSEKSLVSMHQIYNIPAVGASGAIYGVLVAFGISFPNAKLALIFFPVPIAAKYFIPVLILIDLFSGLTGFSIFGGGIAHFAHVGGALIGFLLMWFWRNKGIRPPSYY